MYEVIPDRLYQRGKIRDTIANREELDRLRFDVIVSLRPSSDGLWNLWYPLSDGKNIPTNLLLVVDSIYQYIEGEHKVVIYCNAGRNRSSLVSAMLLRRLWGISGKEAKDRLQKIRPGAFGSNPWFVEYLENLP